MMEWEDVRGGRGRWKVGGALLNLEGDFLYVRGYLCSYLRWRVRNKDIVKSLVFLLIKSDVHPLLYLVTVYRKFYYILSVGDWGCMHYAASVFTPLQCI